MRDEHPGAVSRRGILKGAALTFGVAAAGIGITRPAYAADASVKATSPDGRTSVVLSVTGGVLQWSVQRSGTTVIDTSTLGLKLSNGTVLGNNVTVTQNQHWTINTTWNTF